ncbi:MDIS1-interacting receptor like kinase 2-like [Triticum aestivum]|uniref:MDIS1-interacting receptor like kinase 2-like n=1 Tax=Triticum aestivum TaxID=4565 RepID=UPI001D00D54F|nr:MDIS1-interacting receptor like kinase 2-like [Triticum aestivum]
MLRASNNNITGFIPQSIGQLSLLRILDVSSNKLEGRIPSEIGGLSVLFNLSLGNNLLQGSIPEVIGTMKELEYLDLSSNNLSGSIHGSIEHCSKLRTLKLSHNHLNGSIPIELGMLVNLQDLFDLSDNSFKGKIPSQLGSLNLLENLNLSHNALNGSIPSSFQNLLSLLSMDVSYNKLEGCFAPIVHRDISSNNILLDLEFRACISDFGIAKILSADDSNCTRLAGTKGYLAPELAYSARVTEKCNVYSFGVLTLELFMGHHPEPNPSCRPTMQQATKVFTAAGGPDNHVDYLHTNTVIPASWS